MDVKEYLKEKNHLCSVCNKEFRNPRTLTCKHTICAGCLTESKNTRQAISFRCPTCRAMTKFQNDNQACGEMNEMPNDNQTCHQTTKMTDDSQTCRQTTKVTDDSQTCRQTTKVTDDSQTCRQTTKVTDDSLKCPETTKVTDDSMKCLETTKVTDNSLECPEKTKVTDECQPMEVTGDEMTSDSMTCREMSKGTNENQAIEELTKQLMPSNTISIKTAEDLTTRTDPDDCVVIEVDDTEVLIVTDYVNESVKAFSLKTSDACFSILRLTHRPHSLSVLKQNQVVLSYYGEDKFTVVKVAPMLDFVKDIRTQWEYTCVAVLSPAKLVAGCKDPSCIHILNLSGTILTSLPSARVGGIIQIPRSMCTTKEGNILVTDAGSKSVYCICPQGEVVFHYKPTRDKALDWPRGIAVTESGNILLADNRTNKITQITGTGYFDRDILTSADITSPHGICVYDNKLYVAQGETNVIVFDI